MSEFPLDFPGELGEPGAEALFRVSNADFVVDEDAGLQPAGTGEHVLLHIQKDGENTGWIAREIAACAGVRESDVGYCGLKDRHAITRQWFSVYLPKGAEPDWQTLERPGLTVLATARHSHKLRRGQHRANRFRICLRQVSGDTALLEERLQWIQQRGVPNYFGPQRFGHNSNNLHLARQWLVEGQAIKHRQKKAFALSAARAWLFNQVLAERVRQKNWRTPLAGEVLTDDGLPTGPLWGRGRPAVTDDVLTLEQGVLAPWQAWCEGLEFTGLKQERRALVLMPKAFDWQWQEANLTLEFTLVPGAFATALIGALVQVYERPRSERGV